MSDTKKCLNCGKSENQTPLVPIYFASKETYICPACLPVLIHKTEMLDDKLAALSSE